jgi:hypothetical protein
MILANAHTPRKLAVLLSLLLVPSVGLAAEEVSWVSERIPGTEAPAALRLVEERQSAEPVQYISPVVRVAAEIGAEAVTAFVTGLGGVIPGYALCGALGLGSPNSFLGRCTEYAGYGFLVGASLGAPLGVWWGGKLMGGQGTFLGALLGAGAAALLGAGTTLFVTNDDIKIFVVPVFSLVGAIVGYEVSHAIASSSNSSKRDAVGASLEPVLSFSGRGTALGLSGRF